jgi:RHS repeat-associated protein
MKVSAYSLFSKILFALLFCAQIGGAASLDRAFEPISAPVRFYGTFNGTNIGTVSLNGVSTSETNILADYVCGSWGWFSTPVATVMLDIHKTYTLTISANHVYDARAHLFEPNLHDLLQGSGKNAQQYNRYRLYLRKVVPGGETNAWELACTGSPPGWNTESDSDGDCHPIVVSYELQLRPDSGARPVQSPGKYSHDGDDQVTDVWDRDEAAIGATSAPGDEDILTISGGKGATSSSMDIQWGVNLGRLWDGRSAGKIRIIEKGITGTTLTPAVILHTPRSLDTNEVEMLSSGNPAAIRQIKTPQTFVDVATLGTNAFQINFYARSLIGPKNGAGLYTLSNGATSFVSYRIDSGGASSNRLAIHEIREGQTNSSILDYSSSSNLWTLVRGLGSDARIVTRRISFESNSVNRIEVEEVKNGAGIVSDRTAEVWMTQGITRELVRITNGLGGPNLLTQFTYNTTSNINYLMQVEYPDGNWEKRFYSTYTNEDWYPYGALIRVVKPWKDTPLNTPDNDCHVTVYEYPPNGGAGTFKMQSWHDPAYYEPSWGDPDPNSIFTSKKAAATYEEETWFDLDSCTTEPTILEELRQFGDLEHYGEVRSTKSFNGFAGRLSGQVFSRADNTGRVDAYDYQFGTWDSINHVFTTGGATNDVRQTIFHGTFAELTDVLTTGDSGQNIEPVTIHPYKSTKQVKIISGGNLVAKELYLLTSVSTNATLLERIVYERDALGHPTNVIRYDPEISGGRVIYRADWQGTNSWPGCLKLSETDEAGIVHKFSYDSLKRLTNETKSGSNVAGYPSQAEITTSITYDAGGRALVKTTTAGALTTVISSQFDLAGRLSSYTAPDLLTSTYSYIDGGRQTNITHSSGTETTVRNYLDRRTASLTGSAAPNEFFDYYLTGLDITDHMHPKNVTHTTFGATNSTRWLKSITDNRHALAWEEAPGFRSEYTKNKEYKRMDIGTELSLISESIVSEGTRDSITEFERDYFGIVKTEVVWGETISWGALDSRDRIKTFDWYYEQDASGDWFKVNEAWTYPIDNSDWKTLVSRTKARVTGLTTNTISEVLTFDSNTNQTTIRVTVDRANKKVTTTTTVPESTLSAIEVAVNGLLQTETSTTVSVPTWHYYDALGREIAQKDSLGFISGTLYNVLGQVAAVTNKSGQVTTFTYYPAGGTNAGMVYCESGPTGKKKYYNYNGFGQVTHIWGDVPYPEKRDYNIFGDLVSLTTYRGGSGWNGTNWANITTGAGDVTTWFYDEPTGLLTNKTDAAGRSVNYDYYFSHLPRTTINARGQGSVRLYSINGDLQEIIYSNFWGNSSVVYSNYNRFGMPRTISDDAGELNITYDHAGRVTQEAYTNGLLSGVVVSNRYDLSRGKDRVQLHASSGTVTTDYAFDTRGRISGLTNGNNSVNYAYLPNSDLLQTTTSRSGSTNVLTATRVWEYGYRLKSIKNVAGGEVVSSHSYVYDALDRRRTVTREDSSTWQYEYNDRDELTSGKRFWNDYTPVAGQQFEYAYDNIGNRIQTKEGGDSEGKNLRNELYGANHLNQITARTNSGSTDIIGAAYTDATLTVNGGPATRHDEYFHHALPGGSLTNATWQSVTNTATLGANSEFDTGNLLLPPRNQQFAYDEDGNLTSDGVWSYDWDMQNRLVAMTGLLGSPAPNIARKKLEFVYDRVGRRIVKIVSSWNGSGFSNHQTNNFAYNAWLLLAEMNGNNSLLRSYSWGLDLMGAMERAGGIGGLAIIADADSPARHFLCYDDNGNVVALTKDDGSTIARYEYSPFGETLHSTSAVALTNSFQWSTKFRDSESGLSYYGFRFFDPSGGKWVTRDVIEEAGGLPLYGFVGNNAINNADYLGAFTLTDQAVAGGGAAGLGMELASAAWQGYNFYQRVKMAVEAYSAVQQGLYMAADGLDADEMAVVLQMAQENITERFVGKVAQKGIQAAGKIISASGKLITIRNFKLAGGKHPTGVPFDKDGFPDFSSYSKKSVKIKQTGKPQDFDEANRLAGYEKTPPGMTWHHHQDGTTMQLVPTDIHRAVGHTGGAATSQ